jgi:hypothetical protein
MSPYAVLMNWHVLIPSYILLLEKLIVADVVTKLSALYGVQKKVTAPIQEEPPLSFILSDKTSFTSPNLTFQEVSMKKFTGCDHSCHAGEI